MQQPRQKVSTAFGGSTCFATVWIPRVTFNSTHPTRARGAHAPSLHPTEGHGAAEYNPRTGRSLPLPFQPLWLSPWHMLINFSSSHKLRTSSKLADLSDTLGHLTHSKLLKLHMHHFAHLGNGSTQNVHPTGKMPKALGSRTYSRILQNSSR